jgi:hypothetical protein
VVEQNRWYHIALSYNATDSIGTVYLDGSAIGTIKNSHSNLQSRLCVGCADVYQQTSHFQGYIDEVRVSDVQRYTSDFTVPNQEFSVDGNTVALYHFNETVGSQSFTDQSSNSFNITAGGNAETNNSSFVANTALVICPSEEVQIMASGGTSYSWTPTTGLDDASSATPTASPSSTTTYTGEIGRAENSCIASIPVVVTIDNCTGLLAKDLANTIKVFPNPTKDVISISSDHITIEKVELFSIDGRVVMESRQDMLDVSTIHSGQYFLVIHTLKGTTSQKIIVE